MNKTPDMTTAEFKELIKGICGIRPANELLTRTRLDKANALGFSTVEQMDDHARWLDEHGTPELKRWLSQIPQEAA